VVVTIGLTVAEIGNKVEISEYHWILDPDAHVPVKFTELPAHILGAFRLVGAAGLRVTVTVAEAEGPLQVVLMLFIQIAK
jgi:hypothetical protein